jgi:hypothetical protein
MTQPQPTTPLPRGAYWEQRADGSWYVARVGMPIHVRRRVIAQPMPATEPEETESEE